MSNLLTVVGMDPAYNNWGLCKATYDLDTGKMKLLSLQAIRLKLTGLRKKATAKQKADYDIYKCQELISTITNFIEDAHIICLEVPTGSQSYRSAVTMGMVLAIIGYIKNSKNLITVDPKQIKLATIGHEQATKHQIIVRAVKMCPDVTWPTTKYRGAIEINESLASHMADAIGAIEAGVRTTEFQSLIQQLKNLQ